ncbi:unnamed protein product [Closterium sp. NIES-64]|nr:unnamed protein product [Closterium sp. NIES-65]CAI5986351.1 unnamed protein product [Closterium sp. NIES-64]
MSSLAEYLKRYTSDGPAGGEEKKKKKKKKKGAAPAKNAGGLVLVDADATWQKPIGEEADEEEDEPVTDAPQVEEDVEVRRQRRLEEARKRELEVREDGSGWVTVDRTQARGGGRGDGEGEAGGVGGSVEGGRRGRHDSPDLSPPRRARHYSPDLSPPRRRTGEDSLDLSPPRRGRRGRHDSPDGDEGGDRRDGGEGRDEREERERWGREGNRGRVVRDGGGGTRGDSPDLSPPRRATRGSPDLSPPRKRKAQSSNLSPPRRARHDLPDLSPPCRAKDVSPDLSPPRRGRKGSPDLSPPRRTRNDSPDLSPPRRARHDSPDLSPPRKNRKGPSPDLSPPRRQTRKGSPDLSPPRRRTRQVSPGLSPPRRQARQATPDLSPPRRRARQDSPDLSPPRKGSGKQAGTQGGGSMWKGGGGKAERMMDGSLAGLRSGKEVMAEAEEKRAKDEARFAQLDPSISGRGAQTVYRDKAGKRVSNLEAIMAEEKAKKSRVLPPPEWGKGLVQKRQAERQQADLDAVAACPFAAYENDEERDRMLKNAVRFGDPMAHLVKSNISADALLEDLSRDPAMQASGFTVPQAIPPHSWLKRRVSAPHNRYGIRPGRHWDGVDRSNGFEREMFKQKNEMQAREQEAFMWSVADM